MTQQTNVENTSAQAATGAVDTATLELLARWKSEDATRDPQAIQAAELELAEFKKAMNTNRTDSGEPSLFP
jgi:hypothetical protein